MMSSKYLVLKTTSIEKFKEIRPHFLKYNIECSIDYLTTYPFAVLTEHSELIKHDDGTATIISNLTIERAYPLVTMRVYESKVHGFLTTEDHSNKEPKPWGWDANFIPDGLMTSYYQLKNVGLKISPRDMNIGQFLQDFIHYNSSHWTFKSLQVSRPVDIEADYRKILFDFFDIESQKEFIGYSFWKGIINSAISGGLFVRVSNTRKMNNYWWPVGNAGLPITSKPKDPIHEKTYLMHDIFHYLVPDLLYTGNVNNLDNYEWSYTLHRVMTECFTLVLGDMFYVHYLSINGIVYKTAEERHIYPIFEAIYGDRADVFTQDIIEEVVRASTSYGLHGCDSDFIALFVKYNGIHGLDKLDNFRNLLEKFRNKYDYYLIQDLKWTIHNASSMKENTCKYQYLNKLTHITKRLEIISLDSLELLKNKKPDVESFINIGLKQLYTSLARPVYTEKCILKNKFLRWVIGQLCFFEHYSSIPIVDGNKEKFYALVEDILVEKYTEITLNKIRNFRYQWDYLMDKCIDIQIITIEEASQYKEVFPIFDPHYISSYSDKSENHSEVMENFIKHFEF